MASWRQAVSVVLGTAAILAVAVSVAGAAPAPLTFVWPTSIELEPSGSLLIVENGLHRLVRVDAATGHTTVLTAAAAKPYAVARTRSGSVLLTDAGALKRIDAGHAPQTIATAAEDIGPIAAAPDGTVWFATATQVFRLATGARKPVLATPASFGGPHGIAIAPGGAVLVSDTDLNRVRRIDPKSGAVTTLMQVKSPRGLDVAGDGTIYVVEAGAHRVTRFSPAGKRLGFVGPRFGDPYDLAVGPGGVYVVDTSATGVIRYVARDGTVTTVGGA